jgi:hypothetical protein
MRFLIAIACCSALPAQTVLFRDICVFDGEGVVPRSSVLVENGVIRAVGPNLKQPAAAELIDGEGKTLLPGLIDAHAHIGSTDQVRQALAFGCMSPPISNCCKTPDLARDCINRNDSYSARRYAG